MYVLGWIMLIGALCLTGCETFPVTSVQPLFEKDDLAFDESLLGQWNDEDNCKVSFNKAGANYYYFTTTDRDGVPDTDRRLLMHLVRISGLLFLNASDPNTGSTEIPGHVFFQIRLQPDVLEMSLVDRTWLQTKVVDEKQLSHLLIRRKSAVITASTREQQVFLMLYGRGPAAFCEWRRFTRIESSRKAK